MRLRKIMLNDCCIYYFLVQVSLEKEPKSNELIHKTLLHLHSPGCPWSSRCTWIPRREGRPRRFHLSKWSKRRQGWQRLSRTAGSAWSGWSTRAWWTTRTSWTERSFCRCLILSVKLFWSDLIAINLTTTLCLTGLSSSERRTRVPRWTRWPWYSRRQGSTRIPWFWTPGTSRRERCPGCIRKAWGARSTWYELSLSSKHPKLSFVLQYCRIVF